MNGLLLRTTTLACLFAAFVVSSPPGQAQDTPAPPLVQQLNNGNWLPQAEAEALRDELFY